MKKALTKFAQAGALALPAGLVAMATPAFAAIDIEIQVPEKGYADNIGSLINSVLTFVMVIAGLLVFLYLIWGGIEWITSGGDKGKTESARDKITAAVIGLIILAAAYAILQLALNFLGFSNGLNGTFDQIRTIN